MALSWSFSGATVVSPQYVFPDGVIRKSNQSTISCTWSGAVSSLPTKCLLTRRSTFILPSPAASVDVLSYLDQNAQDLQATRQCRVASFIKQRSSTAFGPHRRRGRLLRASALPPLEENGAADEPKNDTQEDAGASQWNGAIAVSEALPPEGATLLLSCVVGLATGISVVAFNKGVHSIHDLMFEGTPEIGAAWLRQQPLETTWQRLVLVPLGGGVLVGGLNYAREFLAESGASVGASEAWQRLTGAAKPVLKAVAAAVTLGTGNSLGPEGPSVEIGAGVAGGLGTLLKNSRERKLALVAAGSAAGISSGFNAAVAGTFFAVESVLRPVTSSPDPAPSLTTAMVLLSSVLASVVSQAGLGLDPTFIVPPFELRSAAELPLYLLLGLLCGCVSVAFTRSSALATQGFDLVSKKYSINPAFLPPVGGLCVGLLALAYPEVLYWGFENLDVVLQSRQPAGNPLAPTTGLLLQLVGVKLVATAVCRGSGLVGGIYAPSLFMGAALGSAYGKLASVVFAAADPRFSLGVLSLAAPQAYALVGMAAMLAGVCQVPLTAVLLLFELTQDYRIILPLMGAVGLSSWVSSLAVKAQGEEKKRKKRQAEAERREQTVQKLQNGLSAGLGTNGKLVFFTDPGSSINPGLNPAVYPQSGTSETAALVPSRTVELGYGPSPLMSKTGLAKPDTKPDSLDNPTMTIVDNGLEWLAASSRGPVLYTNGAPRLLLEEKSVASTGFEEEDEGELCSLETSLCVAGPEVMSEEELMDEMTVASAMSQTFMTVPPTATVRETVAAMLASRQWCALVVGEGGVLEGILTLADVQAEAKKAAAAVGGRLQAQMLVDTRQVSAVCGNWRQKRRLLTVFPDATLQAAQRAMLPRGLRQLPVVANDGTGRLLGLLDRDNIALACRAEATRRAWALLPDLAEET